MAELLQLSGQTARGIDSMNVLEVCFLVFAVICALVAARGLIFLMADKSRSRKKRDKHAVREYLRHISSRRRR